jgi:hypothetical protein
LGEGGSLVHIVFLDPFDCNYTIKNCALNLLRDMFVKKKSSPLKTPFKVQNRPPCGRHNQPIQTLIHEKTKALQCSSMSKRKCYYTKQRTNEERITHKQQMIKWHANASMITHAMNYQLMVLTVVQCFTTVRVMLATTNVLNNRRS